MRYFVRRHLKVGRYIVTAELCAERFVGAVVSSVTQFSRTLPLFTQGKFLPHNFLTYKIHINNYKL